MDFKNEVKRAAENQWPDIISKICNIDSKILDGRNGPCPKCGGIDRFRMIDKKAGALLCNQCFSTKNGDGLAAIMWLNGCDFPTALNQVAEFLNIKRPTGLSKPAAKKPAVDFGLEFTDWNSPLAKLFCLKKKPISESALLSIGAKQAIYRFHNQSFKVIAIPTTQPDSENRGRLDDLQHNRRNASAKIRIENIAGKNETGFRIEAGNYRPIGSGRNNHNKNRRADRSCSRCCRLICRPAFRFSQTQMDVWKIRRSLFRGCSNSPPEKTFLFCTIATNQGNKARP